MYYFRIAFILFVCPTDLFAASVDINSFPVYFIIPFAGALLSIALGPLIVPQLWHHHYGKFMAMWGVLSIILVSSFSSVNAMQQIVLETLLHEFFPFIVMIGTLYIVTGGIALKVKGEATATLNTSYLLISSLMASIIGTTGAAILLIRPFLKINNHRQNQKHLAVFFIFLVCNIGGCLTVVGDPPLFLGYLNGIDFLWPIKNMLLPFCVLNSLLLIIFYLLDQNYFKRESKILIETKIPFMLSISGYFNIFLLIGVLFVIVISGQDYIQGHIKILGIELQTRGVVRDSTMTVITLLSWFTTPRVNRKLNNFTWAPFIEIMKVFAVIFITAAPVLLMLKAGSNGSFARLIHLINDNKAIENTLYFWLSGILSGFLDNAPTYLVFFNMAGGQAEVLMTSLNTTLLAFSMGSVFMGALTYIGNAPNFIVKAIAHENNIAMPSFFGYMIWSVIFLVPLFILVNFIFL